MKFRTPSNFILIGLILIALAIILQIKLGSPASAEDSAPHATKAKN